MQKILNIPSPYRHGFKELNSLVEGDFNSILEGISNAPLTFSAEKLALIVSESASVPIELVEPIINSVSSLIEFLEKGSDVEPLSENIANIIEREEIFKFTSLKIRKRFISRLITLLSLDHIYYSYKATDLLLENSNVFLEGRILTDIRPVFNINLEEPTAGVIIHKLHLHYRQGGEEPHKDIFIALDGNDIQILKDLLIRAQKKENALNGIFGKAKIINLTK